MERRTKLDLGWASLDLALTRSLAPAFGVGPP
jgi:hypothetical protein